MSFSSRSLAVLRLARVIGPLKTGSRSVTFATRPALTFSSHKSNMLLDKNQQTRFLRTDVESQSQSQVENNDVEVAVEFYKTYREVADKLTAPTIDNYDVIEAMNWCKEILDYNVPLGKRVCGLSVVRAYRRMTSPEMLTQDNMKLIHTVAWAAEVMHAFFQVADDIMDRSLTRRGQPCWYKRDDVGNCVVNDVAYLKAAVYEILKNNIRDQPYYVDVLEAFHECMYKTIIGQAQDVLLTSKNISTFTEEKYYGLVDYKTTYPTCYSTFAIAMYLAGITDEKVHSDVRVILKEMGRLCQIKNDFDDCFSTSGKKGTDIEQNKCSWLIVEALKRANPEQCKVLEEYYGIANEETAAKVKTVYEELKLPELYHQRMKDSESMLITLIDQQRGTLPREMFTDFSDILFGQGSANLLSYEKALSV
ncbi:farnesyl pyrophosphate synthase-like [Glandiceps talaboti]